MTGTARMLRASAGVWVPTVIGVTVAQTLLVLGDPVPVVSLPFIALTLGSGAAFAIGIWLVSRALFLAASGERAGWPEVLRPHPALLWAIAMVVILVLLTLVSPYITVLGIWFGLLVVPAAAGEASNPFPRVWHLIREKPGRVIVGSLLVAVLWAIGGAGMILLGFFVTGALSAALTWPALTVLGTVLLAAATQLHQKALP